MLAKSRSILAGSYEGFFEASDFDKDFSPQDSCMRHQTVWYTHTHFHTPTHTHTTHTHTPHTLTPHTHRGGLGGWPANTKNLPPR